MKDSSQKNIEQVIELILALNPISNYVFKCKGFSPSSNNRWKDWSKKINNKKDNMNNNKKQNIEDWQQEGQEEG